MRIPRVWIAVLLAAVVSGTLYAQPEKYFYNVEKEIRVTGTIQKLILEPKGRGTAPFLSLVLEEKDTGSVYIVEVSPVWFFDQDLHKGESVTVYGSLISRGEGNLIMARTLQCRGERWVLRDQHGFPNWQGGRGGRNRGGRRRR